MITNRQLNIGNRINYITSEGAKECTVTVELFTELEPHNGSGSTLMYYPIPLTEDWLKRMKTNKNKTPFPDWIRYVHEAQNWYYWNNNKTKLIIE